MSELLDLVFINVKTRQTSNFRHVGGTDLVSFGGVGCGWHSLKL
jgi:hypothetical protein